MRAEQSRINIGSDGTLAQPLSRLGSGPIIYFLGPPFAVNLLKNKNLITEKFWMKKK